MVGLLREFIPGTLRRAEIIIFLLVTLSPTLIGRSVRRQLSTLLTATAAEFSDSKGNLLPLPVNVSKRTDEALQHLLEHGQLPEGKDQELAEAGTECWRLAVIATLNHLYQCPQSESGRDSSTLRMPDPKSKLKANQTECMRILTDDIEDFLNAMNGKDLIVEAKRWQGYLGKRKLTMAECWRRLKV